MGKFTKCPNCLEQLVEVPLKKEANFLVCPFCESTYHISKTGLTSSNVGDKNVAISGCNVIFRFCDFNSTKYVV